MPDLPHAAEPTRWKANHGPEDLEYVACPGCGADRPHQLATEWGLGIVRCSACDLIYASPRLRSPERNYWVGEDEKRKKYEAILRGEKAHPRDRNYLEHLSVIAAVKPSGRLLDIGTHCGFFLRLARGRGWELTGVEPSASSAALARDVYGLDVRCGFLEELELEKDTYDVVTMTDVLEHVAAPRPLLREVYRVLAPGGFLFIKVPNASYNLLKYRVLRQTLRRDGFDIFDSREHVVHYTPATLGRVLLESGFSRIKFYVPRPIQAGAAWKQVARGALYWAARAEHAAFGRIGRAAPDLGVLAFK